MDIDFPEPSLIVINQFLNFDVFNLFLQGGLLLFLLVFSAIISGSEVAFFSLSQTEIKKYAKEKNKRLTNAVNLLKSPDKLLANILIVNNLIKEEYSNHNLIEPSIADKKLISLVHDTDYVNYIFDSIPASGFNYFDPDTIASPNSLKSYLLAKR